MTAIVKKPIFLDLDRRRELIFNLNTEKLIQSESKLGNPFVRTIGEEVGEDGKTRERLELDLEVFGVYLWAALYADAHRNGELLTVEDVGALIDHRDKTAAALVAVRASIDAYYGRGGAPGEAKARASENAG